MENESSKIAYLIDRYREGHADEAFHGLLELHDNALSGLKEAFRGATDSSLRAFLLSVIWQYRRPSEIPLLAEALFDPVPEVWKEAMDGLVAFASAESAQALRLASTREFSDDRDRQAFVAWLEEAIIQAESG